MPTKIANEEGVEIEYFTPEEVAADKAEIARLSALDKERGNNFSQFSEKLGKTEVELEGVKKTLAEKETAEKNHARESSFAKYGDTDEIKTALNDNYSKLAGMPETTPAEIQARAEMAAKMAGFTLNSRNPLYVNPLGEAPKPKQSDAKDEFMQSEKGQAALKAMGIAPDKKV